MNVFLYKDIIGVNKVEEIKEKQICKATCIKDNLFVYTENSFDTKEYDKCKLISHCQKKSLYGFINNKEKKIELYTYNKILKSVFFYKSEKEKEFLIKNIIPELCEEYRSKQIK